jgi:hypothetical protein
MLRNDNIIPRLSKGAGDGVTKFCAMQVVSWQNGDTKITDFPGCSARPLARLVQSLNDRLAGTDGFLSPENSLIVLDLGWQTVGTAGAPRVVVWRWLADLLIDPEHGVVKYAKPDGAKAIRRVAELCMRESDGHRVSAAEWREARADAAADAYADAYAYAAADAAADADAYAYAAGAAYADAAVDAAAAAYADAARITFTRWAIRRWRELGGLDDASDISPADVDGALVRIGAK